jgi:hypothetical protein
LGAPAVLNDGTYTVPYTFGPGATADVEIEVVLTSGGQAVNLTRTLLIVDNGAIFENICECKCLTL